jgi:drug/metabolite transporter (DMT)-like permease
MYFLLSIFMYATWTSIFAIGKIALQYSPPIFLTSARMLLASVLILGYLFLRKRKALQLTKKLIIPILLYSVFSIYLTNACEFWGLQHLTAAKTCFIYSLSPFFAALFSYLHFGEKMNSKKWIGMFIGFLGFIPVLATQSGSSDLIGGFSFISWADIAVMGAALFSVYGWVLLRVMVKDDTSSPLTVNGYGMLIGGLFALIHSFFVDSWAPIPVTAPATFSFLQSIFVITIISNVICYNLYGVLLKKFTATFLSFIGLLSPIFASLNGWVFLGEKPSVIILLSTSIVIFGAWIIYKQELKQGYIKKAKKDLQEA